ncbi:MAG: histidine ammonia-lyase [Candidatus Nitrohelix vancouverensis]|uniref:Histidine ammonia-lyase n=1 Tax=Candidatus Nitrohelix vancouverensis TaxID=2705534 RepID=A0A7T0C104_9BACT|nr:MAG: histidine ammonia-lyase [Candidatus Nitrohelix vancouverensis]
MSVIVLDGESLTIEAAGEFQKPSTRLRFASGVRERVNASRSVIENAVRNREKVYGVTTGFGALSQKIIPVDKARRLQKNLLMSHASGVGAPLPDDTARLIMVLMLNSKAKGFSGLGWGIMTLLRDLVNKDLIPQVPEKGSVGASGDLAPLSHLALVLIGRGKARLRGGKWLSGRAALKRVGLSPATLAEGEGLALINGCQVMTAIGALTAWKARRLAKLADLSASMSLEVLLGTKTPLDARIHAIRAHKGQAVSARNMRKLTQGSEIISSHLDCDRIQDAYSLRCAPQVHGASRDVLSRAVETLEIEMNSATENPLVFPDGRILSGGNFHGQPVALAMDSLTMALAEWGNISERRIERMVNPALSGLPSFLIEGDGLNSGFMVAQYAAAALVSENKTLSHPACVDSIPTSANKEDHVSMGTISARKAASALENTQFVVAIELLCAAQALDVFTNLKPGRGTLAAYRLIRRHVPHLGRDRELSPDIETVKVLIDSGAILNAVEKACGVLD